ncbi:GNAT family N-acetyltransferase [Alkalicoccobacillus plakortidis]|nr:GNAT family N-acetyltransferase [Alkalicoccobacillus plakortidis]
MIKNKELVVRPLIKDDANKLVKWLSDPVILQFYEGRDNPFDLKKVHQVFYTQNDQTSRCIIEWEGQAIGYIQYYPLDDDEKRTYGLNEEKGVYYGLDQFIGEEQYQNKGIGTTLIQTMIQFLINEKNVDRIVMDPQVENARALACYEKCGFVKQKLLVKHEWHEGEYRDCWFIMYTA